MAKTFAIRVVIEWESGETTQRDYVRGKMKVSRQAFISFAIGDLIGICSDWTWNRPISKIEFEEIEFNG